MKDSKKPIIWKNIKINRQLGLIFVSAVFLMFAYYAYIYALEPVIEKYKAQKNATAHLEEEPEAAAITESLFTYYAGQTAFDLPVSFSISKASVSIDLEGPEAGGRITFTELALRPSKAVNSEMRQDLERLVLSDKPERIVLNLGQAEDLSDEFGQPALLLTLVYKTDIEEIFLKHPLLAFTLNDLQDLRDSTGPKFSNDYPEKNTKPTKKENSALARTPNSEYLTLNMLLDEGSHRLYFESITVMEDGQKDDPIFLEERKTKFGALVKSFLPLYQWTGQNSKPKEGTLATSYGYIRLPDKGELKSYYNLEADYQLKQGISSQRERGKLTFKISVSATPGFGCFSKALEKNNRMVNGHNGCEYKYFDSRIKRGRRIKPANIRSVLFMRSWTDDCRPHGTEKAEAPHYSIEMDYWETRIEDGQAVYKELAYLKGVWEILLNSIRTVSESK